LASRLSRSWIAALSFTEMALSSPSPQKKLLGEVPQQLAMILVKQRKRVADRSAGSGRIVRNGRMRQADQHGHDGQHHSPHRDLHSPKAFRQVRRVSSSCAETCQCLWTAGLRKPA